MILLLTMDGSLVTSAPARLKFMERGIRIFVFIMWPKVSRIPGSYWRSIRARAIEAARVIHPFWIDKIGGGAGQGVGPDGLPVHQVGAGLDHDGLIGEAVRVKPKNRV